MSRTPLLGLLAALVLAGCGGDTPEDDGPDDPDAGDPVALADPELYAPELFLHSGEDYGPSDALTFIARSELGWTSGERCRRRVIDRVGAVDPNRLGTRATTPYQSPPLGRCGTTDGPRLEARAHTRAFHRNRPSPLDLRGYERDGFALDLERAARRGQRDDPEQATVYYEQDRLPGVRGSFITYWLFYAYNSYRGVQVHEGDWERMVVLFDADARPKAVVFHAHSGHKLYCWQGVRRAGTHPQGFVARGSHATYRRPGVHLPDHANGRGPRWRTWAGTLADARAEPWYGYGGAWGEVRAVPVKPGDFSGPTGPGPKAANTVRSWRNCRV